MRIVKIAIISLLISANFVFGGREDDFNFARKLYDDGYFDLAAEQYAIFIKNYPDDSRLSFANYMRGKSLIEINSWEEARASFLKTALNYPNSKQAAEAFYLAAYCVERLDKLKDAARAYLMVSDYYPASEYSSKGMFQAGLIYRKLGDNGEAWSVFERIISIYPNSEAAAKAYFNLGDLAVIRGDKEDALSKYKLAAQISSDNIVKSESSIEQAVLYYHLGDWDLAENELMNVQSPPELVNKAKMIQGVWMQWRGELQGAEKILSDVLKKSESDSMKSLLAFHLGDNYFYQNEYSKAIEFYNRATESDSLCLRKGMTYYKLDDKSNALQSYLKALKLKGNFENKISALEQLSNLYKQGVDGASISNLLLSYLEEIKNLPVWDVFALKLGEIAFYGKDYSTAKKFFALLTDSNSPFEDDSDYYLARITEAKGENQEALNLYRDFTAKYPGSEYIRDVSFHRNNLENRIPKSNLLQEIAVLTSASLDMRTRGGIALKWGELYYNGFRDFKQACEQLQVAINSGDLTEEENFYAYELMAKSLRNRLGSEPNLADSTLRTMNTYINLSKSGTAVGEFSLYILQQRTANISDKHESDRVYLNGLADIMTKYPEDVAIPEILLEMCKACYRMNSYDKVIAYGNMIQERYKNSKYYEAMLIVRSKAYVALKDSESAIKDLDEYISNFPAGEDLFYSLKTRAVIEQDIEKKISMLKSIIVKYYYNSEVNALRELIGDLYLQQKNYAEAKRYYLDVEKASLVSANLGDSYDMGYKLGLVHYKSGELNKAKEYFLDYTVHSPKGKYWVDAIFALAEISETQGKAPAALKFYQNLITHSNMDSANTAAVEQMASVYYKIGNFSGGRDLYLNLAEKASNREMKMKFKAQATIGLYRQDLLENAKLEAIDFAKEYGNSPDLPFYQASFYLEKGRAQARQKNFSEALESLKYASRKYRRTSLAPTIEYEIGKIYLITNEFDNALDVLTELVEDYPQDEIIPAVYISLGTFYYRQQQMQNALLAFQKVLDNPEAAEYHPTALNNLELTYKDLGLYEGALSMVNQYLERYPFADDVILKKIDAAQILTMLREYDRAIEKLNNILPQVSQELKLEAQFYLGEAYFKKGDFQQALLEYMKVKYLDPGTGLDWAVTALYNTGQCYEKLGNYDSAREIYQEIVGKYGIKSDYGRGAQMRIDYIDQKERY